MFSTKWVLESIYLIHMYKRKFEGAHGVMVIVVGIESVLFQTIQFRISKQFKCKYSLIMKIISADSV